MGLDRDVSDAERVDQLRALEELKAAAAAAQARIAVDFEASQRQAQARQGVPAARRGRGIGAQIALARRESPARAGRLLGLAKALVEEMPHTYAALAAGVLTEWRATLLVRESACLSVTDRAVFDAEVAADPAALDGVGDRRLVARAKAVAYRLDAAAVVGRLRQVEADRYVSLRPAPDTMTYLTGLLPVVQGVGVYAALTRVAQSLRAQGDPRSRGQIMADTLVERVTGQAVAAAVPVEVQVVMTDRALLAGDDEPATIPGYGTVPAAWARLLVHERTNGAGCAAGAEEEAVLVWLRRLFTAPSTGQLVALDSRRRSVPAGLARFIDLRDQGCRTPYCDAPIRHHDHVVAHADGGPTTAANLKGACEACNYAKQAPGWRDQPLTTATRRAGPGQRQRAGPDPGHLVQTITPTGHRYTSCAPALPGHQTPRPQAADLAGVHSPIERLMLDLYWAA
ncbi:DUF222 domain-containing protein [Georgenia yuyongxinii]|uniref:DUF222 domain-containing protein n=2 Tax=Georgenia yuyongxinii TaxID=2589797 RepID=A0A552WVU6_9MICO|nr:DUF222 domain-containing protein [Georgenia yuyongxinii]